MNSVQLTFDDDSERAIHVKKGTIFKKIVSSTVHLETQWLDVRNIFCLNCTILVGYRDSRVECFTFNAADCVVTMTNAVYIEVWVGDAALDFDRQQRRLDFYEQFNLVMQHLLVVPVVFDDTLLLTNKQTSFYSFDWDFLDDNEESTFIVDNLF